MRWALRKWRVWLAVAAAAVAPVLASRDHRTGWTVLVAVVTSSLAVASVWAEYDATHPDRAERRAARQQEDVRAILYRYEKGAHRVTRAERRAARERARAGEVLRRSGSGAAGRPAPKDRRQAAIDEILARYERDRANRTPPR